MPARIAIRVSIGLSSLSAVLIIDFILGIPIERLVTGLYSADGGPNGPILFPRAPTESQRLRKGPISKFNRHVGLSYDSKPITSIINDYVHFPPFFEQHRTKVHIYCPENNPSIDINPNI